MRLRFSHEGSWRGLGVEPSWRLEEVGLQFDVKS